MVSHPLTGAGAGLADGLGDALGLGLADGLGLGDTLGLGDALASGLGDALASGLGDALASGLGDGLASGLASGLGDGLELGDGLGLASATASGLGDGLASGLGLGDGLGSSVCGATCPPVGVDAAGLAMTRPGTEAPNKIAIVATAAMTRNKNDCVLLPMFSVSFGGVWTTRLVNTQKPATPFCMEAGFMTSSPSPLMTSHGTWVNASSAILTYYRLHSTKVFDNKGCTTTMSAWFGTSI
ncbi:MAG: hypothetical protein M3R24_15340 [Chloroflexota bacterium]|nr:hypothetical protein [Chloroflexota bacterium]